MLGYREVQQSLMKNNIQKNLTRASATINLSKLEILFGLKIIPISNCGFINAVQSTISAITGDSQDEPVALLVETGCQQKAIIKLLVFLYTSLQYRYLKFRVSRISGASVVSYGIYPFIDRPFAIYQLNTAAEIYANSNILPVVKRGLKSLVLHTLASIAQYHVSTAGIVILIHKRYETD